MTLAGYLKIDDIPGESRRARHEDEIDVHGMHWKIERPSSSERGSGRARSRARVDSLTCEKRTDAASPYLALACVQGRSFAEMVLAVSRDSGDVHLDHLVITMENVVVSGFEMANDGSDADTRSSERIALTFEKVTFTYIVQTDDHSAGDEHEVEFDVV